MTDTSWLEVDLLSLRQNMQAWRSVVRPAGGDASRPHARLCAVIKADAYGLGAGEIGRCLDQAGIDMLAVYSPGQADELLAHPITKPILVLMPVRTRPETVRLQNALFAGQLHLTVDSPDQLITVHNIGASYGVEVPIHLSVDTGMSRGGLSTEQLTAILRKLPRMQHVRLAGIWTHFAAPDTAPAFTDEQFTRFTSLIETNWQRIPRGTIFHAAASHAALRDRKYHLSMIRIGMGMLGFAPSSVMPPSKDNTLDSPTAPDHACTFASPRLRPILRWRSRLIHVRRYPAGASVGYNQTTRLTRDSYLGLVPVGYADGYPLTLSNKGFVQVFPRTASRRDGTTVDTPPIAAPVLGRINMDQIIVDLTPPAAHGEQPHDISYANFSHHAPLAQVGDLVDVISPDTASPCSLPHLAALAGSSCYELLCRISPRVPRLYLNTAPAPVLATSDRLKVAVM